MKTEFVKPRFDGVRFSEHTLPLEVAKDLAAYETLVVELAKHLYLQDHPDRQRVPKGFTSGFQLHLERVDEGSSRPLLSIVTAGLLTLGISDAEIINSYFTKARDLIAECIAAPGEQLPQAFPRELLAHFNQVGRSLQADEKMELPGAGGTVATLTPERRKHLVLAADKVYERAVELSGSIEEADWEKSTFRLRLTNGTRTVVPMPASFHAQARSYGGRHRHQVTIRGVGAYDSWDQLQKMVSVTSLEVQQDYQLAMRFDELRTLENGWYDGQGIAPDKEKLDSIADKIIGHYPEKLPIPAIVPTPDGNLLLEWNVPGSPSVDVSMSNLQAYFHVFDHALNDVEHDFDLSKHEAWGSFFEFLSRYIGEEQA